MTFAYTDVFITLASTQLEILTNFYTEIFSINPNSYIPNIYAEFQLSGLRLGIFQPRETDISEFKIDQQGGRMSLCLEVKNLESAIAHFTALGYPPPGEIITASHGREIYAYDPDGNRLILHQAKNDKLTENPSNNQQKNKS